MCRRHALLGGNRNHHTGRRHRIDRSDQNQHQQCGNQSARHGQFRDSLLSTGNCLLDSFELLQSQLLIDLTLEGQPDIIIGSAKHEHVILLRQAADIAHVELVEIVQATGNAQ